MQICTPCCQTGLWNTSCVCLALPKSSVRLILKNIHFMLEYFSYTFAFNSYILLRSLHNSTLIERHVFVLSKSMFAAFWFQASCAGRFQIPPTHSTADVDYCSCMRENISYATSGTGRYRILASGASYHHRCKPVPLAAKLDSGMRLAFVWHFQKVQSA